MGQYYYLVSSLPLLVYDETPPLTFDDFYALCREQLDRADYELIQSSHLSSFSTVRTNNPVLDAWYDWEMSLRNELVKLRAQKLDRDAVKYLHPMLYVCGTEVVAFEAFNQPHPLAAEEVLEQARWRFLTELEGLHFFDVEKLVIYGLKLQLLERKGKRTAERGREFFEHMITTKLTEIKVGESKDGK